MTIPVKRSYGSQVMEHLRSSIIIGDLAPGERLNEAQLSKTLGISRTPLREAITMLAAEGWVEHTHNRGARVAEFRPEQVAELLKVRKVLELAAIKFIMEGGIHEHAAEQLERAASRASQALTDRQFPTDATSDFHWCLFEVCENQTLSELGQIVHAKLRAVRFRSGVHTKRRSSAIGEHKKIIDMIRAGNEVGAREALAEHLSNAASRISR